MKKFIIALVVLSIIYPLIQREFEKTPEELLAEKTKAEQRAFADAQWEAKQNPIVTIAPGRKENFDNTHLGVRYHYEFYPDRLVKVRAWDGPIPATEWKDFEWKSKEFLIDGREVDRFEFHNPSNTETVIVKLKLIKK